MNNNKETERAELHKTIWRIANDLRGSVDGWDFKTYVLGMLFYRFISENLTAYLNEQERNAGYPEFEYAALNDSGAEFGRAETVAEKGFYILLSHLFDNVRKQARLASDQRTRQVFGQHHRPVRRCLRIPDADVRIYRWQIRWRVLHPARGLRIASTYHRGRQNRDQQGIRPGLRLRLAAAQVRQGTGPRCSAPGLLRPGNQPHHLQPVPDQHVPARRELRKIQRRPRRHPHRPGPWGR